MIKVLGLTGGIGVGKSTVADFLKEKGYGVYDSDTRAKELMVEDKVLKKAIINLLGEESYDRDMLNTKYVASKIFTDKELLQKQNALVHKAVAEDFRHWKQKQKGLFCVKEVAILFESGANKDCDAVLTVVADEDIRIERVMKRNSISREEVQSRIKNQWSQEKLISLSDYRIDNSSTLENLKKSCEKILKKTKEDFS